MNSRIDYAVTTRQQIMDLAEAKVARLGFNGFSYGDVAFDLRLTNAGIHYHFPSKADLGVALIERHAQRLKQDLESITRNGEDPLRQLHYFCGLFESAAQKGELRMSGMLAAEFATLPKIMQQQLHALFQHQIQWLSQVLDQGMTKGRLAAGAESKQLAHALASALQGALLVSRVEGGHEAFKQTLSLIVQRICRPEQQTDAATT